MTALRCCSLTGLDEKTDIGAVLKTAVDLPIGEWGVLYSTAKMDKEKGQGRYPREDWIQSFIDAKKDVRIRTALHICGDDALKFLREDDRLFELASHFTRVQLNVSAKGDRLADDLDATKVQRAIHHFTYSHGNGRVILQLTETNRKFIEAMRFSQGNWKDMLIDGSAGQGILPNAWPEMNPFFGLKLGYAGGLGPDNIEQQLPLIDAASDGRAFWFDMESGLIGPDKRFDLSRATQVLPATSEYVMRSHLRAGEQGFEEVPFATTLENMHGKALDWWSGLATGYAMNPVPTNASRATYLDRYEGEHRSFSPSDNARDLEDALGESDVGCKKVNGTWIGLTSDLTEVRGFSRSDAMLRASIADAMGTDFPINPACHPTFMERWVGQMMTDELLPSLTKELQFGKPRP